MKKSKHSKTNMYNKKKENFCPLYPIEPESLSEYLNILFKVMKEKTTYWFRGNENIDWELIPSALRYDKVSERNRAIDLIGDFKRYAEMKLRNTPSSVEEFKWVQIARHYGLPTRLLDWTRNASVALYFACQSTNANKKEKRDGAVYILNPIHLNIESTEQSRIFDPNRDEQIIKCYLKLRGNKNPRGRKTIAVEPVWNSERIMLQQSAFTLHGSRNFCLTREQAPGLLKVKLRKEIKDKLLKELESVGINEMSIFPEAEHLCNYLRWRKNLHIKD